MQLSKHWQQQMGTGILALMFSLGAGLAFGETSGGDSGGASGGNLIINGDAELTDFKTWLHLTTTSNDPHGGEHCFEMTGHTNVQNHKPIAIDPDKTYTLSGWFKSAGEKPSNIYFGFAPLNAKKQQIASWHVNALAKTQTTLTEACAKGDTVIKVADASKWVAHKYSVVAFDTASDFSDLPNRQTTGHGIKAVQNKGDYWEVTLAKPCKQTKEAGTPVRVHRASGSYMYSAASSKIVPNEWTQFSAKIKGHSIKGSPLKQFWPGTKFVRILILANWGMKKEGTLLIDDLELTAE